MHQISKVTKKLRKLNLSHMNLRNRTLREWGYLLLLFNARAVKAKSALRDTVFTTLLPLSKTKGKGSKPFGLAEVQL